MKLTKEDIDKVRHIEGFPVAKDEDIIALSNAPYYTACPNPFIKDFISEHGKPYDEVTDDYHREPFAADVSEGKTDPIYMAHSYHTKVPYKAIMRYILHYTEPGDFIFDGFSGTGMTGVAAQMCGNPDPEFKFKLEKEMSAIKWGKRKAILNDLSPIATFITSVYNSKVDLDKFEKKLSEILENCIKELGWVYETNHNTSQANSLFGMKNGIINYTIWSDVFLCPHCGKEIIFWDAAIDKEVGKVKDKFVCDSCGVLVEKKDCTRAINLVYDNALKRNVESTKQVPVLINYTGPDGKRYQKRPDDNDLAIIQKIDDMNIPYWYPTDLMLGKGEKWGDSWRAGYHQGITCVHHFFAKRNLLVLSYLYEKIKDDYTLKFLFTSILQRSSKLFKWSKNQAGPLSGTLYVSSCIYETSIFALIKNKKQLFNTWKALDGESIVNCASLTDVSNIPNESIDYIFTDPPFGDNLMYSELSFIWEAWLQVKTDNNTEVIMNKFQSKGLVEYQELMTRCFEEYYRVIKPGRWMTVEFHNSKNAVWNAIQESLQRSGFIIADVRTLDKQQGSFKQVNNHSAVKQDLVISAYKPKESFKRDFIAHAGSEETAWDFVRQHLGQLPIVVVKNDKIELIAERQAYLLFDRMVAYHIMNFILVPIDAADFYKGLDVKFLKRDGMYFLHDQINEYDTARITTEVEPVQMVLNVTDEKSAISWLYGQIDQPQTYAEIQPKFMQEIRSIDKYEQLPELSVLLEDNFVQNNEGRWYIPDVTKAADVIKLREKRLLKEFEEYLNSTGKLKLFRTEAIRVGFAKLWKDKYYTLIVKTAERLPESVIQEDDKLLMYYDISLGRVE